VNLKSKISSHAPGLYEGVPFSSRKMPGTILNTQFRLAEGSWLKVTIPTDESRITLVRTNRSGNVQQTTVLVPRKNSDMTSTQFVPVSGDCSAKAIALFGDANNDITKIQQIRIDIQGVLAQFIACAPGERCSS
jgi:hypothetical protein